MSSGGDSAAEEHTAASKDKHSASGAAYANSTSRTSNGTDGHDPYDPQFLAPVRYLCGSCSRWFSREDVLAGLNGQPKLTIPFSLSYNYLCVTCTAASGGSGAGGGISELKERPPTYLQISITAMANLTHYAAAQGLPDKSFAARQILPFINQFWDAMTGAASRTEGMWQETIIKTLASYPAVFHAELGRAGVSYSLLVDINHLNPYDISSPTSTSALPAGNAKPLLNGLDQQRTGISVSPKLSRGQLRKRLPVPTPPPLPVPRTDLLTTLKAFPTSVPHELPTNPNFRYILAECDRTSSLSESYINNPEAWHGPQGRPIPGHLYRVFVEDRIALSIQDQAPQLKVSNDRLSVIGDKGYSCVRANQSVGCGRWYYELTVRDLPGNAAVRAGWGTVHAALQAPLGYDRFGYSWRSRKGTVFHASRGRHYSEGYTAGDVLGCYIELPADNMHQILPDSFKQEPLVKYKNHFYYESREDIPREVAALKPRMGSQIIFFKNGKCCGTAFTDINNGRYFPAVSLYKNAAVSLNFGPVFQYPPTSLQFLPMNERVWESAVEQTVSDILYSVCSDVTTTKRRKTKSDS
ncbi:set1/Ash2 histone methyltransferase complex subunit ASH2-like [Paramacrobiotus metropolitanus]|uniref:set1/Ash2 histone methyltransferase complex subunit ASH2-like n=1 Tax=Paramacrobiotus metropolitanus TaxID=2943436 RepID=UPI0024463A1C|nr:set1/Ash2 histone methyltransferase complex subunit ASH2-like [Paramacrobiotus metropolitanus]